MLAPRAVRVLLAHEAQSTLAIVFCRAQDCTVDWAQTESSICYVIYIPVVVKLTLYKSANIFASPWHVQNPKYKGKASQEEAAKFAKFSDLFRDLFSAGLFHL